MPRRPAGHCLFLHTKQGVGKPGSRCRKTRHTYLANFPHLSKGKGRPKFQTSHTISGKIAHHSHTPKTHDKQNQTVRIFAFLAANPYPGTGRTIPRHSRESRLIQKVSKILKRPTKCQLQNKNRQQQSIHRRQNDFRKKSTKH